MIDDAAHKSVMLTGANGGYVGAVVKCFLEKEGYHVTTAGIHSMDDCHFDLEKPADFQDMALSRPVSAFIHMAAANEVVCRSAPYRSLYANVAGTRAALEFSIRNHVPYFVYVSTFHVFGRPRGRIDENTPPYPLNDYGLSHLQAEEYIRMYCENHDLKGLIFRPSNFFGMPPDLKGFSRWALAPFEFAKTAVEQGMIELRTTGYQKRNFVPLAYFSGVLKEKLECPSGPKETCEIRHIAGGESMTIRELAGLVKRISEEQFAHSVTLSIPSGENRETEWEFCSIEGVPHEPSLEGFETELIKELLSA